MKKNEFLTLTDSARLDRFPYTCAFPIHIWAKMRDGRDRIISELLRVNRQWVSQSELQKRTGFSKSYVSEVLTDLEKGGFVKRIQGEGNSRKVMILMDHDGKRHFRIGLLRSTEYVPLVVSLSLFLSKRDMSLDVSFSDNPVSLYNDLSTGIADAVCSPLISLGTNFIVRRSGILLFGVASGGSSVFENPESRSSGILTSENSTMSTIAATLSEVGINHMHSFLNPASGVEEFLRGKYRHISIWEPYATRLKDLGYKDITYYSKKLLSQPCCGLVVSDDLGKEFTASLRESIAGGYGSYHSELDQLKSVLELFSSACSFDTDLITRSMKSYDYRIIPVTIETFRKAGINMTEEIYERFTSVQGTSQGLSLPRPRDFEVRI